MSPAYIDVLFAQRDMWQARMELIDTKQQQRTAMVDTYQALGGGWQGSQPGPAPPAGEALPVPTADDAPSKGAEALPSPNYTSRGR